MKVQITKSEMIRKALRAGAKPKNIAKRLGVPVQTVYTLSWKMKSKAARPSLPVEAVLTHEQADKVYQETVTPRADSQQYGGAHYKEMPIQPWAAMEAWLTTEAFKGFLRGNAIKYLARADKKGGIDDIKKARHYVDKLVEIMELPQ